ncbi:MAG: hypothetical protein ACKPKO_30410 [Candidatus Fonsibacter sp.]
MTDSRGNFSTLASDGSGKIEAIINHKAKALNERTIKPQEKLEENEEERRLKQGKWTLTTSCHIALPSVAELESAYAGIIG